MDQDYNVPEQKEDVGKIVYSSGKHRIETVQLVENYVKVTGKFYVRILYMTDTLDERPAVLETQLPFEEMIYAEGAEQERFFVRNMRTEFTPSLIHSRKLSMRVSVELELGREKIRDEDLTVDVEGEESIYKRKKTMNLLELAVSKKDTYRIKEELVLPGTKESVGQILLTDVTNRNLDLRLQNDMLTFRGELLVFCFYTSVDGKPDWIEQTVSYEGSISCNGVTETMYDFIGHGLEDTIVDARLDEDGEMRVLGIEATLELQMNIYREEEVELLEDLYSLEKQCQFEQREGLCEELLLKNQSRYKLSERLLLPELKENVLQIMHSEGTLQVESETCTEEGIKVEGILYVSFLYLRADDEHPYGNWQGMVPFSYVIDCPQLPERVIKSMAYYVEQLEVVLAGSETVDVKAVLAFDLFLRKGIPFSVIDEVELCPYSEEQRKKPGLCGHIVQPGEDLWMLAKKYVTTVENIKKVNHLEGQSLKTGDKLLIMAEK